MYQHARMGKELAGRQDTLPAENRYHDVLVHRRRPGN